MDAIDWFFVFIGVCIAGIVVVTIVGGILGWPLRKLGAFLAPFPLLMVASPALFIGLDPFWTLGAVIVTAAVLFVWMRGIERVAEESTPRKQRLPDR